jgi:hypothetical protein
VPIPQVCVVGGVLVGNGVTFTQVVGIIVAGGTGLFIANYGGVVILNG